MVFVSGGSPGCLLFRATGGTQSAAVRAEPAMGVDQHSSVPRGAEGRRPLRREHRRYATGRRYVVDMA